MRLVQTIYEKYRGLIYRLAMERARDKMEADDIVSETLQRLFRNAETLQSLREKQLVGYLGKTVHAVAVDTVRSNVSVSRRLISYEDEYEPADEYPGVESDLLERESERLTIKRLYETLAELSETDRLLLVGKYMEDASDEALARQLGVKAASIGMKLTRARRRARKIMERKEAVDNG